MSYLIHNRRKAIKILGSGAAATAVMPLAKATTTESRPNIIVILLDDHRYDAMGFMGKYPWLKTPNIDRLAKEGVHFANSFVTTSLCSPSRASFITGQRPNCHGVTNNVTPWLDSNQTFLELLHAQGYDTGFIGKWHMPGRGIPDLVGQGKVDRMVSFSYIGGSGDYIDCPLIIDGKDEGRKKGYLTDILTQYALEFMDRRRSNPFCLYLSHKAVHAPFYPSDRRKGSLKDASFPKLQKKTRNLPLHFKASRRFREFDENIQKYYEVLLSTDDSLGLVLDFLDAKGITENTLVIFTSDNGYMWGEHGLLDKRYAYEESIRVPHLLRFPGLIPEGGKTVTEITLNIDLAPTILCAGGISPPRSMPGRCYLDLAQGRSVPWRKSFLYEYFNDPGFPNLPIKSVRTQDWKLIKYLDEKNQFPDEMYNLARDPREQNDLAETPAYATKKKELENELKRLESEISCS